MLHLSTNVILLELKKALYGKPQKRYFFSGPATKALPIPPSPSSLVATFFVGNFFRASKKLSFLSSPYPISPLPLLVAGPLKKRTLFAASPYLFSHFIYYIPQHLPSFYIYYSYFLSFYLSISRFFILFLSYFVLISFLLSLFYFHLTSKSSF